MIAQLQCLAIFGKAKCKAELNISNSGSDLEFCSCLLNDCAGESADHLQLEKDLNMSLIPPTTTIRDHARTALALGLVKF